MKTHLLSYLAFSGNFWILSATFNLLSVSTLSSPPQTLDKIENQVLVLTKFVKINGQMVLTRSFNENNYSNYWHNIDMTVNVGPPWSVTTIIYVFKEMKANIALQRWINREGGIKCWLCRTAFMWLIRTVIHFEL